MNHNTRILIVGAGIAGTALAKKLEMHDLSSVLIEKRPKWQLEGYTITLMPSGTKVMHNLGLFEELKRVGSVLQRYILQKSDGRMLRHFDLGQFMNEQAPAITVHRATLQKILLDSLATTKVRWGTTIDELQQTQDVVTVRFDNGQTEQFDLVIGSDGVHSPLRELTLSAAKKDYMGVVLVAFMMPIENIVQDKHCVVEVWDSRGQFGIYPYGAAAAIDFSFPHPHQLPLDYPGMMHQTKHIFKQFDNPFVQCALHAMPDMEELFIAQIYNTHAPTWYSGRVCCIGDAVHAILPTAGMGASLAIGDAEILADAIVQTASHTAAFEGLMRTRRNYVHKIQQDGIFLMNMMLLKHPWTTVRNIALCAMPTSLYTRQFVSE